LASDLLGIGSHGLCTPTTNQPLDSHRSAAGGVPRSDETASRFVRREHGSIAEFSISP